MSTVHIVIIKAMNTLIREVAAVAKTTSVLPVAEFIRNTVE